MTEIHALTAMTENEAIAAGAVIGSAITIVVIMAIIYYIFIAIAGWKIFEKAGIEGWKSLIPIYNLYLLYKLSDTNFWIWLIIPSLLAGFTNTLVGEDTSNVNPIVIVFVIAVAIYSLTGAWKFSKNLATSFNKSTGFAVGLFFFPNIFELILGFGKAEYNK